jgi:hypothetical protein
VTTTAAAVITTRMIHGGFTRESSGVGGYWGRSDVRN